MAIDAARYSLGDVMLADGTMVSDLIDRERREVDLRVLSDPQLYQLEIDRLFTRTWIMVGHETEIPEAGDFMVRTIGEDVVIVARQSDGSITISLNVCTHRGMQVCRAEYGNASTFKCPYHGWVFKSDGEMVGAPFEQEMYGDVLAKPELGLRQARVESLGGVIFGNFDPNSATLAEFFGDFYWYLQMILCRTDDGLEVLGAPQRATIRANWKTAAEQGAVDGYHAIGLHRSFGELGFFGSGSDAQMAGLLSIDISASGSGLRCMPTHPDLIAAIRNPGAWRTAGGLSADERLQLAPPCGMTPELVPQLRNNLTDAQIEVLSRYYPSVGEAFPSFEFLLVETPVDMGHLAPSLTLHTWGPKGPDAFELWTWVLAEKGVSDEEKRLARKAALRAFGTSGSIEMDDGEAWPSVTRSARGGMGRREKIRYQTFHGHNPPPGWPGPGTVHTGVTRDDGQWGWWQRYFRYVLGEE